MKSPSTYRPRHAMDELSHRARLVVDSHRALALLTKHETGAAAVLLYGSLGLFIAETLRDAENLARAS